MESWATNLSSRPGLLMVLREGQRGHSRGNVLGAAERGVSKWPWREKAANQGERTHIFSGAHATCKKTHPRRTADLKRRAS